MESQPLRTLNPSSLQPRPKSTWASGRKTNSRSGRENTPPPVHSNVPADDISKVPSSLLKEKRASSLPAVLPLPIPKDAARSDALVDGSAVDPSYSSAKVVVRLRPASSNDGSRDRFLNKVSSDSLSVGDRTFTFDSVLGSDSTQEDVFKLVGVPLVNHALAGLNTSVVSYGQTGSGKTYTMWGPPSAMIDSHSINDNQGMVARIFRILFSEINRKQGISEDKQINYQCRCSFLEIYNEQIYDLLDPTQRNLQIRDDVKNGFYVENLTYEYVTSVEDVTQILVKGLSNRRVGATSINSKSSRSHIVFTCIIESWSKEISSKYVSSCRTSRISLFDLAGSDRDKPDGTGRHVKNERRHVKQSLAKLGKLVNILGEASHAENDKEISYKECSLTHLLQEVLGGNSLATFLCTIFPDERYKSRTLSTLRFAQQARRIKAKAVINEITEDDVNGLSDQIRQLKDELIRARSFTVGTSYTASGCYNVRTARDTLNQLRVSLNRSLMLPCIDNESDKEIDVDEDDVKELCVQFQSLQSSVEDNPIDAFGSKSTICISSSIESFCTASDSGTDSHHCGSCSGELIIESVPVESEVHVSSAKLESHTPISNSGIPARNIVLPSNSLDNVSNHIVQESVNKSSFSISLCEQLPVLQDPTVCSSPKMDNNVKKNSIIASDLLFSKDHASESQRFNLRNEQMRRSDQVRSSKVSPTESLAASLHRGLQIIDYHQRNSSSKREPIVGLSFEHLASVPCHKVDVAVQTVSQDGAITSSFLCHACKRVDAAGIKSDDEVSNMQIVAANDSGIPDLLSKELLQDCSRLSADSTKTGLELETLCVEQAKIIIQLNCLADKYRPDLQESSDEEHDQERRSHLEVLGDTALPVNDIQNYQRSDEQKLMKQEYKNHHEILKAKHSLMGISKRLDDKYRPSFDLNEREALLVEIQRLKNQLKSSTNVSTSGSLLEQIRNGGVENFSAPEKIDEELEKERQKWTESESRWISLTEELRLDLESNRRQAENKDYELTMEKKCTAELDDALQRAILGHARIIEHYVDLQEKHNSLLEKYRKVMEGIAEVKKAAKKAGAKGAGPAFVRALAAELSTLRLERERERAFLKEQNKGLRIQLRDTAEAVHAAGELLVRLREAEESVSSTQDKYERAQAENEKLRRQVDRLKKKHAMEMMTMKHYLAESRLPESALDPLYGHDSEIIEDSKPPLPHDDHGWRAAFTPSYH